MVRFRMRVIYCAPIHLGTLGVDLIHRNSDFASAKTMNQFQGTKQRADREIRFRSTVDHAFSQLIGG
jgi:hypothetical protein